MSVHNDPAIAMIDEKITLHGVFMEVLQLGVLLSGASGVGKSELALELINRGHRLIADDAPEFSRSVSGGIEGRCPEVLRDFLEVRGLGVIDVRAMFGDTAVMPCAELNIVLQLKVQGDESVVGADRLRGSRDTFTVLEKEVPRITLPVAPGRNLAILVETAVSNQRLMINGYDAAAEFSRRQRPSLTG
jgi:HPr kinase/phosphorylase